MEAMTTDSEQGVTLRELFLLPHERDSKGNIIVRSSIPAGADIRDSLVVDTTITDPDSVMRGGVVVAGRHRRLEMPYGGSALFCAADRMKFNGPHAIAFKSIGDKMQLEEGDRTTCLFYTKAGIGNALERVADQLRGRKLFAAGDGQPDLIRRSNQADV